MTNSLFELLMLSPKLLINIVFLLAVAFLSLVLWFALSLPYAGFGLERYGDSVVVRKVEQWQQANGLNGGDKVISAVNSNGLTVQIQAQLAAATSQERRRLYDNKAALFQLRNSIYQVFTGDDVTLNLADGRKIALANASTRNMNSLPTKFWLTLGFGFSAWMLGVIVWVWQPLRNDVLFLMLSGFGLFLTTIPSAIYSVDYFKIYSYGTSQGLSALTALGNGIFLNFAVCCIAYFPSKLKNARVIAQMACVANTIFYIVIYFNTWQFGKSISEQTLYFSDFEIYLNILWVFPTVLLICYFQWTNSKSNPLARARCQWVLLSYLLGPGLFVCLYVLPSIMGRDPLVSRLIAWLLIVCTYLMILLGVGRFKLFQLEQHVVTAWIWAIATLFFLGLDFTLLAVLDMNPKVSSIIVVLFVLWIYSPARHWLANRMQKQQVNHYNNLFSDSVVDIVTAGLSSQKTMQNTWNDVLEKLYSPISITCLDFSVRTEISNRGQFLRVEGGEFSPPMELAYADRGKRLFNVQDREIAEALHMLFNRLIDANNAFSSGQNLERNRIKRDLHDQIGHKLLSLIYAAKDEKSKQMAQETMDQLRDIVRALRNDSLPLTSMLAELRGMFSDFCVNADIESEWKENAQNENLVVNSHQCLNILNIFRELLNNGSKHSSANKIMITVDAQNSILNLDYSDNGLGFDTDSVVPGDGLFNIQTRVQELNGLITRLAGDGFALRLTVPLEK